nr:uncharacterized protein LOC129159773 [Nothobranchius furzeri]
MGVASTSLGLNSAEPTTPHLTRLGLVNARGWNSCAYVRAGFPWEIRVLYWNCYHFEMCLFELGPPPLLLVALIYRPPKFDVDFLKDFSDLLSVNMLNCSKIKWRFLSLMSSASLADLGKSLTSGGRGGILLAMKPGLEKLTDTDDIEHFLITFERIAASCNWPMADWVFHLVPLLTGKARSAYVHMDIEERFRSTEVEAGETPKELYVRLKELYDKWIHPQGKTVKDIGEMIVLEQFLRMLSPELQVWVREHDPPSASKAASLAEVFVAARRKG